MKTHYKISVSVLLITILGISVLGCGKSVPGISGQDYVAVEPIPEENGVEATHENIGDDSSESSNQEINTSDNTEKTYFENNGMICTADRSYTSDAIAFFVNSDKTEVVDNQVFSFSDTKCLLSIGECKKSINDDGNIDVTILINGQIETLLEENAESEGTEEFDFAVNYINFNLVDKYSGIILLGKSNIDNSFNTGEKTVTFNGIDYDLKYSENMQWSSQQWDVWSNPSETGGYTTSLKWPFVKTITMTVPDGYEGIVLALPKEGTVSANLSLSDNTDKLILDADYDGAKYSKDEMVFIDVNALLQ